MKKWTLVIYVIVGVVGMFFMDALFFSDNKPVQQRNDTLHDREARIAPDSSRSTQVDTDLFKEPTDLLLLDFAFQQPDYTKDEYDTHWYTQSHEPEITKRIETDSSVKFTLMGNIPGGQPIGGKLQANADTLFLCYYIIKSRPGYAAIRKVQLDYEISPRENVSGYTVAVREIKE